MCVHACVCGRTRKEFNLDVLSSALGLVNASAQENNAWSAEQAQKQMDFQERMSNTAHQRQVADLKAAGLNPVLSAKLNGASTPTGASADTDTGNTTAIAQLLPELIGAAAAGGASGGGYGRSAKSDVTDFDPWVNTMINALPTRWRPFARSLYSAVGGSETVNSLATSYGSNSSKFSEEPKTVIGTMAKLVKDTWYNALAQSRYASNTKQEKTSSRSGSFRSGTVKPGSRTPK